MDLLEFEKSLFDYWKNERKLDMLFFLLFFCFIEETMPKFGKV